jgi:hypothetical protein
MTTRVVRRHWRAILCLRNHRRRNTDVRGIIEMSQQRKIFIFAPIDETGEAMKAGA